jgi:hypothetical protein
LPLLNPKLSSSILGWLNDDSLGALHWRLIGLLPLCGSAAAHEWLESYYDLTTQHFEPTAAPYKLVKPEPYEWWVPVRDLESYKEQKIRFRDWAERSAGGDRYVVCVGYGFASRRELLLGIDRGSDGSYEELLPTGLTDSWFTAGQMVDVVRFRGPLALTLRRGAVTITHHEPVQKWRQDKYDQQPRWHFDDTRRISTTLLLADLRLDSDGDGLTDIAESRLLTNPHNADTDGDGEPDRTDRAPTTNPATMGPRERGVARALLYEGREELWTYSRYDYQRPPRSPYAAWYAECTDGLGHFTFAVKWTGYYLIPLTGAEAELAAALVPAGDYFAHPTEVGWSTKINNYDRDYWFGAGDPRIGVYVYTALTSGQQTFMTLLDGEWYPVYSTVTWIM